MRRHLWIHVGMVAAIIAIFGLDALGVAVPVVVVYLVMLGCPLMMGYMMFGTKHGRGVTDHGPHGRRPEGTIPPLPQH